MLNRSAIRLYGLLAGGLASFLVATPAAAQFTPTPLDEPPPSESYHIEGSTGFWMPAAEMTISSESLGIPGSTINFKKDLALTDQRFGEVHLVLRPARKHKFRFQYIPIKYSKDDVTVARDIVFNGQLYRVGLPVNWSLDWKAYRFAYEYDFIARNHGFAGVVFDAKYTDVSASLQSPLAKEFAHARGPIPAVGGIGRYYVVPNISITGELTGIKIPDSISKDYKAHYVDFDLYGTVNATRNIGAKFGYRSYDVGYLFKRDSGSFVVKGVYFAVVARY
jgi:hypothetical protein